MGSSSRSEEKRSLQSTENFKDYDPEKLNSIGVYDEGQYADTSKLSFQDLLKIHQKQTVWGVPIRERSSPEYVKQREKYARKD